MSPKIVLGQRASEHTTMGFGPRRIVMVAKSSPHKNPAGHAYPFTA